MKNIYYILILIIPLSFNTSKACDCGDFGGFAYSSQIADLVAYGEVIAYDSIGTPGSPELPYSIKFLIKEKIRGIESSDTIIIFGDNGFECRPYIEKFKPNTKWIVAVDRLQNTGGVYELSICGEFHLAMSNGIANGRITNQKGDFEIQKAPYHDVKKIVKSFNQYPIYRRSKTKIKHQSGIEYVKFCDILPNCFLDNQTLTEVVNDFIFLPEDFMKEGDNYLVHVHGIVTTENKFIYNGIYQNGYKLVPELESIETAIEYSLKGLEWHHGFESNKPINGLIIIPILLEK